MMTVSMQNSNYSHFVPLGWVFLVAVAHFGGLVAFLVLLLSRKNTAHFLTRIRKDVTGIEINPKT